MIELDARVSVFDCFFSQLSLARESSRVLATASAIRLLGSFDGNGSIASIDQAPLT
jgi:hypothetical protein